MGAEKDEKKVEGGLIIKNKNNINFPMEIINHNGQIKLTYKTKIVKKIKKYKTRKGEGHNTFYQAYMPQELITYLRIRDNTLYFYQNTDNQIVITGRPPLEENIQIKIQKSNQFSLSRKIWKHIGKGSVVMTLDFSVVDPYMRREGLLTILLE